LTDKPNSKHQYLKDYVPLRRGLKDHVIQGKMTMLEFTVFNWLLVTVGPIDGIRWTTAPTIAKELKISAHSGRRIFESLKEKEYIHYEGAPRGLYPVLVLKFLTTTGKVTSKASYPRTKGGKA
jgi:hypothetical protein